MRIILTLLALVSLTNVCHSSPITPANVREATCHRIFNELKAARGIAMNEKPILKVVRSLTPNKYKLALADNVNGIIQLEKTTVNLCFNKMGMDSLNALAFILSHELSHYIHQHNMVHKFISNMVDVDSQQRAMVQPLQTQSGFVENSSRLDSISSVYKGIITQFRIRQNESQADLDAGFTSYLAGYDVREAGVKFFDLAYPKFNISDDSGMYPKLEERKEIIKRTSARLDTLLRVFEAANYLSVIKEFDYAEMCYDYVSKEFRSKSIINNLGVIQLRKFTELAEKSLIKYALPITMEIRFGEGTRNFESAEARIRILTAEYLEHKQILDKAISYFDHAASLDNNYALPLLNKSISYYLMSRLKIQYQEFADFIDDDIEFANTYALLARQIQSKRDVDGEKQLASNIYGMLAIIQHEMGQGAAIVDSLFDKGLTINPSNPILIKNKSIIKNNAPLADTREMSKGSSECTEPERFGGRSIDQIKDAIQSKPNFTLVVNVESDEFGNMTLFKYMDDVDNRGYQISTYPKMQDESKSKSSVVIAIAKPTITETACFVELNQPESNIKDFYGDRFDPVETANGRLTYLKNSPRFVEDKILVEGIIFNVQNNLVKGWSLFKTDKKLPTSN